MGKAVGTGDSGLCARGSGRQGPAEASGGMLGGNGGYALEGVESAGFYPDIGEIRPKRRNFPQNRRSYPKNGRNPPGIRGISLVVWSGQRESNPHDQYGKLGGYHYIMPALFLSFTASAGKFKTVSGLGELWKGW